MERPMASAHTAMLAPYSSRLQFSQWPPVDTYNAFWGQRAPASNQAGKPIRFVAQEGISDALGYEQRVYETGIVATRERNWHDLFNALVWCNFARSKAVFNARHYEQLRLGAASANQRTRVQDALTLFDESGVIVVSDDDGLLNALRAMRWKDLFWQRRADVIARMRFVLFGHGLCEQALRPFVGLTGKAWLLRVGADVLSLPAEAQLAALDAQLARCIDSHESLSPAALCPLPILGVPGWWEANEHAAFYENTSYFRSRRSRVAGRRRDAVVSE